MAGALQTLDFGDALGLSAAEDREAAQRASSEAGIAELRRQFDLQQERTEPFFQQSKGAIDLLSKFSGIQGDEEQSKALAGLLDSPGAKFRREQAQKNILRSASASGQLGGGNVLKASQQQGIASAQSELNDELNRLSSVAGTAQSAGDQLGQAGQNFASSFAQQVQAGASNQANSVLQQQQAKSSAAGTAVGIFSMFSDEDMKKDIRVMSNEECFDTLMNTNIKAWKYLEEFGLDDEMKERIGPMYQESPDCIKVEGMKALDLHDELWLIAGALKHFAEKK